MKVESICLGDLSTNCYLIAVDGINVLIDPAEPSTSLLSFLGERKIDLVINTHGHFDHVGGNWVIQERGARVLIHKEDVPLLDEFFPGHPPVDGYLSEGDRIVDKLEVLHVPGHSPGSIALAGEGVLFTGDLLFAGSIGRTDLPGGSMEEMKSSLVRIAALPGDCDVYPGHGAVTTLDRERRQNPFLVNLR